MKKFFQIVLTLLLLVLPFAGPNLKIPKARAYDIRQDHPRIFLTTEKLARLKELKNRNTTEWRNVLTYAGFSLDRWDYQYIGVTTALAYQVSGEISYANKAKEAMNKLAAIPMAQKLSGIWGILRQVPQVVYNLK